MTRSRILSPRTWAALALLIYTLAHLLAAAGLIAFGLRADGYPLNRWGIYGYGAAALVALALSLSELRRHEEGPSSLQLTLPPLLALWVASLYFTTVILRAEFAPYLDDDGLFALLNLAFALAGCGLALGYRWPRLLTVWAGGQGLLLLTNPGLLSAILRYGARWDPQGLLLLLVPVAYGLSALALGYRVRRRRLVLWFAPFILAGIAAAVVPVHRLLSEPYRAARMAPTEMELLAAMHGLSTLYAVALVLGLPCHAWGASRTWPPTSRDRAPGRWVWPAFLALVYLAARAAASWLTVSPGGFALPAPGEVQGWVSPSHVVPDAYPGFFYWLPTLLAAVRWLLLLVALVAAWETWRQGVKVRLPARDFPSVLAWPALASLAAFVSSWGLGFVLMTVWEGGGVGLLLTPLIAGLGLLGLARLMEALTPPPPADAATPYPLPIFGRGEGAGGGVRALAGLATVVLLAGYLWWQGRALVAYAHVLLAPLPVWAERWKYAPFDPRLAATIGLVFHSSLILLGLWALWRTWQALARPTSPYAVPGRVWLRVGLGVAVVSLPLVGFWYWWTDPGVMETVPPQGATGVPRDTVIVVRFGPESPLREFWSSGQGMSVHYADTQEYIPGGGGGWIAGGMYHDPDGLLRPNAPVEAVFHRQGRRPFVLRFTTAGADSPSATPMPRTFGPPESFPTPVPPPTPTRAVETPTTGWTTYRNAEGHFSFDVPPGWGVAEGYTMIYHYRSGLAAVNSLGRDGFWITQQQTGPNSWGYNPEVVLNQLPPGAVYFEVGLNEGPPRPPQYYGPEMEAQDLTPVREKAGWEELVPGKLARLELRFDKWGRTWSLLAYLAEPVTEADRRALDRVLDSFQFDAIPCGDERWAILQARQHLPAAVHPRRFPLRADSTVGQEGALYKTEAHQEGDDVIVTFTYDWARPATGAQDVCQTGRCHRWIFRVTATGQVILVSEEGEPLAVMPTPLPPVWPQT